MIASVPDGYFITVEGGEGSGKTTQLELLTAAFERAGIPCHRTREPGGTELAESIRSLLMAQPTRAEARDPQTESLLLTAARRHHVAHAIQPKLAAGIHVLCDRFMDSTLAYQGGLGGLGEAWLQQLYGLALGSFRPHLSLFLMIDPTQALERVRARGSSAAGEGAWFDASPDAAHRRIHEAFQAIAAREPERCHRIDAAQPREAVHAAILTALHDRLGLAL